MKSWLVVGIVLTATTLVASSAITWDAPGTISPASCFELYLERSEVMAETVVFGDEAKCDHDKLKAEKPWVTTVIGTNSCPSQFLSRMYKCKECKAEIFIQSAIEMPKLEPLTWSIGTNALPHTLLP